MSPRRGRSPRRGSLNFQRRFRFAPSAWRGGQLLTSGVLYTRREIRHLLFSTRLYGLRLLVRVRERESNQLLPRNLIIRSLLKRRVLGRILKSGPLRSFPSGTPRRSRKRSIGISTNARCLRPVRSWINSYRAIANLLVIAQTTSARIRPQRPERARISRNISGNPNLSSFPCGPLLPLGDAKNSNK